MLLGSDIRSGPKGLAMSDNQNFNGDDFNWMLMDRIDGIWWGAAFIWGAWVLLFTNTGWPSSASWWDAWGVFFVGIGFVALVCAAIRIQTPEYRSKWLFSVVWGVVFLAIGLGAWEAAWWLWVLVLLIIGAVTLRSALNRET